MEVEPSDKVPPETMTAFIVADLLSKGILTNLKKCALPLKIQALAKKYPNLKQEIRAGRYDCENYFLANKKGRWCSNRCGTKFRKAESKEKKRAGQMI
jgi:hypothetical protein